VVTVEYGGHRESQPVGSQASFVSHNDRRLHFGLGAAERADRILVRWPSGASEVFPAAEAGRTLTLVEGKGTT
jgi:hypothetical protein